MKPRRLFGLAAVAASAVMDGIIESSSGRAMLVPNMPRRNVRRGKCFLVMYDIYSAFLMLVLCPSHLKRGALDYAHYEGRKTIIVARGVVDDGANRRHVVVFDAAAERVGHQLLG